MAMRPAFAEAETFYATTMSGLPEKFGVKHFSIIPDCNRNEPLRSLACLMALLGVLLKFRPRVVISTGALPGLAALMLGRMLGARTIWIDSLANVEGMSMSGRYARRFADHWITQWPAVAQASGAEYCGRVL